MTGGGPITVDLVALITGATGSPTGSAFTSFEFEQLGLTQSANFADCHMTAASINSAGVLSVTTDQTVGTRRIFFTINYAGGVSVSGSVEIDVAAVGGGGGGGSSGSSYSQTFGMGSVPSQVTHSLNSTNLTVGIVPAMGSPLVYGTDFTFAVNSANMITISYITGSSTLMFGSTVTVTVN